MRLLNRVIFLIRSLTLYTIQLAHHGFPLRIANYFVLMPALFKLKTATDYTLVHPTRQKTWFWLENLSKAEREVKAEGGT
jgi:hypothetical protein